MYNQITQNKRRTWLLIIIFCAIIIGIGYSISLYNGSDPTASVGIALVFSTMMALFSYYTGDKIALATAGAQAVTKSDDPRLYNMIENLCITAGLKPVPKIFVIQDPSINAFATGRDPTHASIAITTGAIDRLENEELEGVIAHELSHITNYDIRLMTVVIVLVGAIALLGNMFRWGGLSGGRRRSNDNNEAGNILAIVGIVFIILSPIIAELIKLAVSRRREYLADASGALLTRYPEGLARALEKIRDFNEPLIHANAATAHLYLDNPFRGAGTKISNAFSTHPPLQKRIDTLRGMEDAQ
ncbi:MAG: M48 family metallopeptidase [Candidatus Magasanikbacteria bacterium]|nr:M48 family metallopeptidase [Candidatus Magasanikbacteria bacterium]